MGGIKRGIESDRNGFKSKRNILERVNLNSAYLSKLPPDVNLNESKEHSWPKSKSKYLIHNPSSALKCIKNSSEFEPEIRILKLKAIKRNPTEDANQSWFETRGRDWWFNPFLLNSATTIWGYRIGWNPLVTLSQMRSRGLTWGTLDK